MFDLLLFTTFFKIGLFTIGGGYAMIPMIQQSVLAHGWMTVTDMIDFIAISESTPGPFAVNIATFIGMTRGGIFGALAATLGVVLPSFIIILLIARFFLKFQDNTWVKAVLTGVRPAVVGLIASAALSIFVVNIFHGVSLEGLLASHTLPAVNWRGLIIVATILVIARWKPKLHPIFLILISGALGVVLHLALPFLN